MNDSTEPPSGGPTAPADAPVAPPEPPVTLAYARPRSWVGPAIAFVFMALGAALGGRLAIESMVFGLCALALVLALVWDNRRPGRRARPLACAFVAWTLGFLLPQALAPRPRWRRSPPPGPRVICLTRLKGIGNAIEMYRMDNADAWPNDLHALVAAAHLDARTLECPRDRTPGGPDYFYTPPAGAPNETSPSFETTILACDYRRNHRGSRSVLFADNHVERVDESDFQSLLALPENADFAAALRAAEGP
ncbi:MAG: hypothetical protein GX591_11105 [Planctomycetes bacterium]|nr:hypothetical protein [Planctomycetota bacterium]